MCFGNFKELERGDADDSADGGIPLPYAEPLHHRFIFMAIKETARAGRQQDPRGQRPSSRAASGKPETKVADH